MEEEYPEDIQYYDDDYMALEIATAIYSHVVGDDADYWQTDYQSIQYSKQRPDGRVFARRKSVVKDGDGNEDHEELGIIEYKGVRRGVYYYPWDLDDDPAFTAQIETWEDEIQKEHEQGKIEYAKYVFEHAQDPMSEYFVYPTYRNEEHYRITVMYRNRAGITPKWILIEGIQRLVGHDRGISVRVRWDRVPKEIKSYLNPDWTAHSPCIGFKVEVPEEWTKEQAIEKLNMRFIDRRNLPFDGPQLGLFEVYSFDISTTVERRNYKYKEEIRKVVFDNICRDYEDAVRRVERKLEDERKGREQKGLPGQDAGGDGGANP